MNSSIFFNKVFRRVALTSAVALGAFGASGSFAASSTTTATSTVIAPIAITKAADLSFGEFAPSATAGTVIVDTAGGRSATGGVVLSTTGSTINAAKFDVSGEKGATYSISWTSVASLTDAASTATPKPTMTFTKHTALTADGTTGTTDVASGTLDATTGAQSIFVGELWTWQRRRLREPILATLQ